MRLAQRDNVGIATSCADLYEIFPSLNYLQPDEIGPHHRIHKDWRFIVFEDDPIAEGFSIKPESIGFPDSDPRRRNIDLEFERIPRTMRDIYLEQLAKLKVSPKLQEVIDDAVEKLLNEDTIAVHMRTWMTDDWDSAPKRHQHYFDLTYYEKLLDKNENVFISSDNSGYLQQLVMKYGDRIKYFSPPSGLSSTETAFISLSLLSRPEKLVGSSLSTFTEMAWWLSGCRSKVELVPRNK